MYSVQITFSKLCLIGRGCCYELFLAFGKGWKLLQILMEIFILKQVKSIIIFHVQFSLYHSLSLYRTAIFIM